LELAILVPVIPLIIAIVLIGRYFPNQRREGQVNIDVYGIFALILSLCGILLPLNFAPGAGWTNPWVLLGFVVGILGVYLLIRVERRAKEPLIPLRLFRNARYSVLLLVGFLCYFYQIAMNVYSPIGALQVMGASTSLAGALQMPRSIIIVFLPAIAGAWMVKRSDNTWKAMAISSLLAALSMLIMGFTTVRTSILVYFFALALTGVAESFRSVSILATAQSVVDPEDIGVGTSLVNFINSLSGTVGAAVFGAAYNLATALEPGNVENIALGVNTVFLLAAILSAIGFFVVLLVVRPLLRGKTTGK